MAGVECGVVLSELLSWACQTALKDLPVSSHSYFWKTRSLKLFKRPAFDRAAFHTNSTGLWSAQQTRMCLEKPSKLTLWSCFSRSCVSGNTTDFHIWNHPWQPPHKSSFRNFFRSFGHVKEQFVIVVSHVGLQSQYFHHIRITITCWLCKECSRTHLLASLLISGGHMCFRLAATAGCNCTQAHSGRSSARFLL